MSERWNPGSVSLSPMNIKPMQIFVGAETDRTLYGYSLATLIILDYEQEDYDELNDPQCDESRAIINKLMLEYVGEGIIQLPSLYGIYPTWLIPVTDRNALTVLPNKPYSLRADAFASVITEAEIKLGFSFQFIFTKIHDITVPFQEALNDISLRINSAKFFNLHDAVIDPQFEAWTPESGQVKTLDDVKFSYEKLFFNYIFTLQFQDARDIFKKIMELELMNSATAISIKVRVVERLSCVMYTLGNQHHTNYNNNIRAAIRQLSEAKDIGALKAGIDEIFRQFSEDYGSENDTNRKTFDLVLRFIDEHFSDIGLCGTMICNQVGISPVHLSRQFRKLKGMSMVDYINSIRVARLKELLLTTDFSQSDLVAMCGFTCQGTMARVFKKLEGITPGQYRMGTT